MDIRDRMKRETAEVESQVKKTVFTYMSAGLGLVVGLAWNDAISALIKYLFPVAANTILAKFVYALLLTLFVTLAIVYLEKLVQGRKARE